MQGGITYYIQNGNATPISYDGITKEVVIPATIEGYPVTDIGLIFQKTDVEKITIPGSITTITPDAFASCKKLKVVVLSDGVKVIGAKAFQYCSVL